VTYSATGANPITQKTVSEPPVGEVISAPVTADGETTFHISAKDRAGNVSVNGNFPVDLDTQKPNVTITATPDASARNGWHADTVNVTVSATDPRPPVASGNIASGVASITYELNGHPSPTVDARNTDGSWPMTFETSFDVVDEGINTVSIDVIDVAGNDDHEVRAVQIDRTAPATTATVTPAPNVDGFNGPAGTIATVNFAAVDEPGDGVSATDVSGIHHVTYSASGAQSVPATTGKSLVVNKEGTTTVRFFATDVAGNIETSRTVVVKLDFTAPTVQIPLPATSTNLPVGAPTMPTYLLGQPETLSYSCADEANGSGLASCGGAQEQVPGITALQNRNLNGALDTSHVGLHTVFVTGTDKVGNSFKQSVQFRVVYNVCPQYDLTKAALKGSTVAIKLRLCTYSGTNVSSPALTLRAYQVDNGTTLLSPNFAGSSNTGFVFRYDPSTSTYIYNLQTTKNFPSGANVMTFTVSGDPLTPVVTTSPPAGYSNLLYRALFRLK